MFPASRSLERDHWGQDLGFICNAFIRFTWEYTHTQKYKNKYIPVKKQPDQIGQKVNYEAGTNSQKNMYIQKKTEYLYYTIKSNMENIQI